MKNEIQEKNKTKRQFREENILEMFKEMNDEQQSLIYRLVWEITTLKLLYENENQ